MANIKKYYITIDLGTTNIKVAIYNSQLEEVIIKSSKIIYSNRDNFREFNADSYLANHKIPVA